MYTSCPIQSNFELGKPVVGHKNATNGFFLLKSEGSMLHLESRFLILKGVMFTRDAVMVIKKVLF